MTKPIRVQSRTKLPQPAPAEVKKARLLAGLTQTEAAQLLTDAGAKGYRTWQRYEASVDSGDCRHIPIGLWELFLLLVDQHPTHKLIERGQATASLKN